MPELNKSDGDVLTAADIDDIDEQMIVTCTSSTRPSGVDGRFCYETDTGKLMSYNSTAAAWSVAGGTRWVSFTPAWTNLTVGNGTNAGRYRYVDGGIRVMAEFVYGTTSSVSGGDVQLSIPNSETSASGVSSLGCARLLEAGVQHFTCNSIVAPSNTVISILHNGTGNAGVANATNPIATWSTGDVINIDITVRL